MPKDVTKYLDIWGNRQTTDLRAFVEGLDTALNARYAKPNKWQTVDVDSLSPDEQQNLRYSNYPDGGFATGDDFPRLGRHMAFVGAFSFLDHKLFSIRERCRKSESITLDFKGKSNWGLKKAKECFNEELNISIASNGTAWERLLGYDHIRNLIVHCDSRVRDYEDPNSAARKKFEKQVAKTQPININSLGQFTLSREYCLKAIDHIESYFQDVLLPLLP